MPPILEQKIGVVCKQQREIASELALRRAPRSRLRSAAWAMNHAGDQIWINANEKHRFSCAADSGPVRGLQVAFGNCQQDDIKRYDDDCQRA